MYTAFNSYLDLKEKDNQFISIIDAEVDGNFILHHFISQGLSSKCKVILLGFAQTLTHYTHACHKLGINLQNSIKEDQFCFVDMLSLISESFLYEKDDSEDSKIPEFYSNQSDGFNLKFMYDLIQSKMHENCKNVILIDDLTALINMGCAVRVIGDFIHYCKVLTTHRNASFIVLSHHNQDDLDYSFLLSYLKQYATLEVHVKALQTGYSKDLSGEITSIKHGEPSTSSVEKRFHFKLLDKDVKFFALGTSSAVL